MPTRIDKLTPEQEAAMEGWAQKWISIGLCCEPADREKAEKAYRACYRYARLKDDVPIIWVQSPVVGAFAASISRSLLDDSAVGSAVDSAVYSAVYSAVGSAVGSAVYSAVDSAVYSAVDSAVYSAVYSAVDSAVRSAVDSASLRISWHGWLGGQLWAYWPAFEGFFREVCKLTLGKDLTRAASAYAATSEHAGYWWPNKRFIIACDRPRSIKRDPNGQLHSETGLAIEYRDGWGLYAWHGTVIPAEWIEQRDNLTPDVALKWQNAEQRRAACEIIGWDNLLQRLGAKLINKDSDDTIGQLYEVNHGALEGRARFLRMYCPTGRWFAEPVPLEMKTALEANAWGWGLEAHQYNPTTQS